MKSRFFVPIVIGATIWATSFLVAKALREHVVYILFVPVQPYASFAPIVQTLGTILAISVTIILMLSHQGKKGRK